MVIEQEITQPTEQTGFLAGLVIISVCKDNPRDLEKTCQSVAMQNFRPARHIVVDGSDRSRSNQMSQIAAAHGAEYFWFTPRGIYEAMLDGLTVAGECDAVWYLNATDWLARPDSIAQIGGWLSPARQGVAPVWCVGQTLVGGSVPHRMRWSASGEEFVRWLRRGRVGLSHPSTVVLTSALREVFGPSTGATLARDYEMALELAERFGPPQMLSYPLSIYDESGQSAKYAYRNLREKMNARIRRQPFSSTVWELFRAAEALWRHILRRVVAKRPSTVWAWRSLGWEPIRPEDAEPFWSSRLLP